MTPAQALPAGVAPLRPALRFDRVEIVGSGGRIFMLLVGFDGSRSVTRRVVIPRQISTTNLRANVRAVAEHFAIDLICDRIGAIDPARGPRRYNMREPGHRARPRGPSNAA